MSFSEQEVEEFKTEAFELLENAEKSLLALDEGNTEFKKAFDTIFRAFHNLKGAAGVMELLALQSHTHELENILMGFKEKDSMSKEHISLFLRGVDGARAILNGENIQFDFSVAEARTADMSPVETPPVEEGFTTEIPSAEAPAAVASPGEHENCPQPTSTKNTVEAETSSSIRVPIVLLDNLMTLMGEMVLVRNQVLQFSNQTEDLALLSMSKRLNAVTSEIQEEMMKTRMQPVGGVLNKFNRVVRDLSQSLGKKINLSLFGAETELDKSLLEAIKDPLTHIVRNSCDHGLETPDVRHAMGKPETGTISIRSYHEGGQVIIEVKDDGKGLDKMALLNKALEKGIISQVDVPKLSDKQIYNLIFAPGFSTAAQVTNVSGRGVGMDVVKTNIERIGGTIELSSTPGSGMSTKLRIPLTLAIIPALIVKCGEETFAIPQAKLEELVRVDQGTEHQIEYLHDTPVLRLRGNILPLLDLNQILNKKSAQKDSEVLNIAVLNAEQNSFGLIIDQVQDTADIVVKPLNRLLKSLQIYSGATILGDGAVALILDIVGISKVAMMNYEQLQEKSKDHEGLKRNDEIQDYLLVKTGSPTKHAIVLGYVHRLEEFKKSSIEHSGDQRVIRYGKDILPIISLNAEMNYPPSGEDKDIISVVVIRRAGFLYGIEVDGILDTLSTLADLDSSHTINPKIFGNLNTENELIVVINPFEIIANSFPLKKDQEEHLNSKEITVSEGGHILLAEDTAFFRKAIRTVLERSGYTVTTAADGQEAFDLLSQESQSFDLVISDIEMPRMNGFELAQAIRKHSTLCHLPLMAVSSRADVNYMEEGKRAGFNIYLEKLKAELLLKSVKDLIHEKSVA